MTESWVQSCTACVLAFPFLALLALGLTRLLSVTVSESGVTRIAAGSSLGSLLAFLSLAVGLLAHHEDQVVVSFGRWFSLGHYDFPLEFLIDGLSLTFLGLTLVLSNLVVRFSARYLHREPGFHRFFLLFCLFVAGMNVLVLAGTVDLLFFGWELVGLSSALLVAFFQRRREPLENGLRVFAIYRLTDVGLLVGAVLLHHYARTSEFDVAFGQAHWPSGLPLVHGLPLHAIALLFLLAAMGKSAQFPFGSWLPRAMEGPTPSSAIFYGGISIHAGAYLLLRAAPLLDRSPPAKIAICVVGLSTALLASGAGRVQADAKNQLAFAAMAQVGLVFVEIALGLRFLALLHIVGHASVRTLQFLRAPSVLSDFHGSSPSRVASSGASPRRWLPVRTTQILYAFALERAGMEPLLDRFLFWPVARVALFLERAERKLGGAAPTESEAPHPEARSQEAP